MVRLAAMPLVGCFVVIGLQRWPIMPTLAAATPALAFGHAIGRVGCLLVGDDYGRPTDLPWGIAFPEGLPPTMVLVHPTQIYVGLSVVHIVSLIVAVGGAGLIVRDTKRTGPFVL